ncbi:hypothetical protein [Achromobacter insolitus]|uniref:hypothetical protein n=1 Tax=Achromobacter insolitus TaxID=217204 RepID=UPI001EED3488|nr:hypothetical protein [Achromobacter insolitus]
MNPLGPNAARWRAYSRRWTAAALAGAALFLGAAQPAAAAGFPDRPVTLVVPSLLAARPISWPAFSATAWPNAWASR